MTTNLFLRALVWGLVAASLAVAEIPDARAQSVAIPVQGILADAEGRPRTGQLSVAIRLYDVPMGGAALFEETQDNVQFDSGGRFTVYLGLVEAIPEDLFRAQDTLYAEVEIDGEVFPGRVLIGTVPYAARAEFADVCALAEAVEPGAIEAASLPSGVIVADLLSDGSVTTPKLASEAVTGEKLAADAVSTDAVVDGAITTAKIAGSAVTGAQIADRTIERLDLAPGSVTSGELADDAVTAEKLGPISVTSEALRFDTFRFEGPRSVSRSNTTGVTTRNLGSTNRRFCFLTSVSFRDIEGGSETPECEVQRGGTSWSLRASLANTSDADAFCSAMCISW